MPTWHLNNYWTEDNPNAYLPRYSGYYNPLYKGTANTRYLQDVSYIRLKTSSLGIIYQRNGLLKLVCPMFLFISPVRIYGSWSPLYRYTKDYDVTVVTKGSDSDITSGNKGDGFNYPTMRNFSFGISITY